MDERLRDGLLALAALVTLVAVAVVGDASSSLLDPVPAATGVAGALALEWLLLRYPERTRSAWERPAVQAIAFALVAAVGISAIRSGLGWVLAALAWGLGAYLALLTVVVAGYRNPLAR